MEFETIITLLFIAIFTFLPILVWGYLFSYIDDSTLNRKRFLVGIIAGGLSVIPILHMDYIVNTVWFELLNVFNFVANVSDLYSLSLFYISIIIFLLFLAFISFFSWFFMSSDNQNLKKMWEVYLKNILLFVLYSIFIWGVIYLISISKILDIPIDDSEAVSFSGIVFNSFKLVLFYYILVGLIEEISKHFHFIRSSLFYINSVKTWVLYAIFVALGFSFIENILYFYNLYNQYGIGKSLVITYIFRSVFSVLVHILCSSVIAYYFSKYILWVRNSGKSFSYIKMFMYGILISTMLHTFFDVSLTLGFSFIIFIYFIGWYLYITNIFYKE